MRLRHDSKMAELSLYRGPSVLRRFELCVNRAIRHWLPCTHSVGVETWEMDRLAESSQDGCLKASHWLKCAKRLSRASDSSVHCLNLALW